MRRVLSLNVLALLVILLAGCGSLPGLRVLTGQEGDEASVNRSVEALDLVMADKTGATDPALTAAADRIEAANASVDIIEIRQNLDDRLFSVNLLFRPPNTDNSLQGQAAQLDALRRAIELTWQGTMRASEGADLISVRLLNPQGIATLDNGLSFVGVVLADAQIERAAAANYLAGTRSLNTFFDLIAQGTLVYETPDELQLYEGQPNHPLFMLPTSTG